MKQILKTLFEKSIELGDEEYTADQIKSNWIGNPPVSKEAIQKTEERLGIRLPRDYVEMLSVANGFPTCCNSVMPSFEGVEQIDLYKNFEYSAIKSWKEVDGLEDIVAGLERAILIAGLHDEQQFLIIPPDEKHKYWRYWLFALWLPGEEEYKSLEDYFHSVVEFLEERISEKQRKQAPR